MNCKPIQMVDLKSQYQRFKSEIDSGIAEVIESTAFINGPQVGIFEKKLATYCQSNYVIGCANGTDALQIALMALNLPKGSEIITPSFSYAALAEVILLMDFVPVFVEVHPDTFLINENLIAEKITSKTKVIAPVHLYGQCANMEIIMALANKHNLYVIEDTAQAIGATCTYKGVKTFAGTIGSIGTTSFFPSKNLGCYGDGGALLTMDEDLAIKIKMIANHGQSKKYTHTVVGLNSRLDTLQAAILNVKVNYLNNFEVARNTVANYYTSNLQGLDFKTPIISTGNTHVFHQYTIILNKAEQRDELKTYLDQNKIPSMVYYPIPLHWQEAYKQNVPLTVTEDLCTRVLSLPISTEMDTEQLNYICTTIKQFFKHN